MSSIKTNRPISSTKQASTPIGAPLMIILGVLCLAAAPALIYAPTYFPQSAGFVGALGKMGVTVSSFLSYGFVMLGFGTLARYQTLHTRKVLEPGQVQHDLEQVDAALSELKSQIKELSDEQRLTRDVLAKLETAEFDHAQVRVTHHAQTKDAIFRLAGGLNEMSERLSEKFESESDRVKARVKETHSAVDATREYLLDSLEDLGREMGRYLYEFGSLQGEEDPRAGEHDANGSQSVERTFVDPESSKGEEYVRAFSYEEPAPEPEPEQPLQVSPEQDEASSQATTSDASPEAVEQADSSPEAESHPQTTAEVMSALQQVLPEGADTALPEDPPADPDAGSGLGLLDSLGDAAPPLPDPAPETAPEAAVSSPSDSGSHQDTSESIEFTLPGEDDVRPPSTPPFDV